MSASLVGSEMCIRDRPAGVPPPPSEGGALADARRAYAAHHGLALEVAVSYTHLTLPTICSV
eukprot:3890927-Alexandrium_andersonii.AAC.1